MMASVNVEKSEPVSGNTMDISHSSDSDSDRNDTSKSHHQQQQQQQQGEEQRQEEKQRQDQQQQRRERRKLRQELLRQQQQQQQPGSTREREFNSSGSSEDDNVDANLAPGSTKKNKAVEGARDSPYSSSDDQTSEINTERSDDRPSSPARRDQGRESPTSAPPVANQSNSRSPSPPSSVQQDTQPRQQGDGDDSHRQQQRDRNEQVTTHDDDYELTDDQRQAMTELEQMKLDIGYTDGVEEDPPEYDVRERVRKLNEELANDPTPEEDERSRSIKFREDPVDLVVSPPPDYSGEDDDDVNARKAKDGQDSEGATTTNGKAQTRPKSGTHRHAGDNVDGKGTETDSSEDESVGHDNGQTKEKKKHGHSKSEDVLVERNGTFELVPRNELNSEEKAMYCAESDESSSGDEADVQKEPHPPAEPRPASANGSNRKSRNTTRRRAQSAGHPGRSNQSEGDFNYNSPYGMTDDQKKKSADENKEKRKKQREEETKKKEEDDEKRKNANDCFNSWLRQKRKDSSERRKQNRQDEKDANDKGKKSSNKDGEDKKEISFKDWESGKRKQKKQESEEEERQRQEIHEGWYMPSKQERDRAFRKWLKKKKVPTATLR